MFTRIEASDRCSICGDAWCRADHSLVAIFGSALWRQSPHDIDVLYAGVSPEVARNLATEWARKMRIEAPIELHEGRGGTIWAMPGVQPLHMLRGKADMVKLRDFNVGVGGLPMYSSLLRRYPYYDWSGQSVAVVADNDADRVQVRVGLAAAGFDIQLWQPYLNRVGEPPLQCRRYRGDWIVFI